MLNGTEALCPQAVVVTVTHLKNHFFPPFPYLQLSNKEKHEEYLQVKISPTLIHSFKRFLQKIFKVAKAKSQLDQVNAVKYVLLDHYGGAVNVPNLKSRDDIQQLPKDIKPLGEHHVRAW